MMLPGQSRQFSKRLQHAVAEAESGLGRRVVFLPLAGLPDSLLGQTVRGFHESRRGEELIWLDAGLPFAAAEATAAHELAHVVQQKEGYPRASSIYHPDGRPVIPALERLARGANNLVMDESADLWAVSRGFNMGKALTNLGLDRLIRDLNRKEIEAEAADWGSYYARLETLAAVVAGFKQRKRVEVGAEADTQSMVLDYAGLSLRLGRYGLFDGLESMWAGRWPVSREMGQELAAIVKSNGVETGDMCRRALEKITAFLRIPPPLIIVR